MAQIFPFRGIRYSSRAVGDLADVMVQPYDKITPQMQDAYYDRHDKNFARVIKGRACDGDNDTENLYTRANAHFRDWLADGTLVRDEEPCLYVYKTEFAMPGTGQTATRTGFIALAALEDFSKGGVKPHERTFEGPKADRLSLMRTTGANTECIFMLYSDPERTASRIIEDVAAAGEPDTVVTTEDGERHALWLLSDPDKIAVVAGALADKDLFIADGHHRYETAVNYMNEMHAAGKKCEGTETYANCMMTFVNMADELTILPTHRLVGNLPNFDPADTLRQLEEEFEIQAFSYDNRNEMLKALTARADRTAFGFYAQGLKECHLLTLKDGVDPAEKIAGAQTDAWKRLDVVVLHDRILGHVLGVAADAHDEGSGVWFERIAEEGLDRVRREGEPQAVFLLNPTRIGEVQAVAGNGERMPQKSTDFYPKLLSGLVVNEMRFV